MSERRFAFMPEEYYHVYNRGNSKQDIFLDARDYERFVTLLYVSNGVEPFKLFFLESIPDFKRGAPLVAIGAYCLMPNHFHLLLTPLVEGGVATFMRRVMTGYAMYFNNKYKRTGSLFEGKYKGEHANDDVYLKHLFAYIHLNPAKLVDSTWRTHGARDVVRVRDYVTTYPYSSMREYLGTSARGFSVSTHEHFPEYFDSIADMNTQLFEWLTPKQEGPV